MQQWVIANSETISFLSSVACVVALAVVAGFGLEEVLVVAEVLEKVITVVVVVMVLGKELLLRFGKVMLLLLLEEVVGLGMGRSAAMTSASMSSKPSSA
jgi:hypothetical protein